MKKLLIAITLLFITVGLFAEVNTITSEEEATFMNWFSQRGYVGEDGSSRSIKDAWENYLTNAQWGIDECTKSYDRYNKEFTVYFPYVSGQFDFLGKTINITIHFYAFEQSDGFIGFGYTNLTLTNDNFKEKENNKELSIIYHYLENEAIKKAFSK